MSIENVTVTVRSMDALMDRVQAWVGIALTKAKVQPVPGVDFVSVTVPPFRKFAMIGGTEGAALDGLRTYLEKFARAELLAGRELPTWESKIPEVPPNARRLVRLSNLRHELLTRAAMWGAQRQNLPAGAVERCLNEIDAAVTRHAMQINGSPPRRNLNPEPQS